MQKTIMGPVVRLTGQVMEVFENHGNQTRVRLKVWASGYEQNLDIFLDSQVKVGDKVVLWGEKI